MLCHMQKIGNNQDRQDSVIGLMCLGVACCTSGLGSVYCEKLLKQSNASLWIRNMQFSLFSIGFALAGAYHIDGLKIQKDGFMQGFSLGTHGGRIACCTVLINA